METNTKAGALQLVILTISWRLAAWTMNDWILLFTLIGAAAYAFNQLKPIVISVCRYFRR